MSNFLSEVWKAVWPDRLAPEKVQLIEKAAATVPSLLGTGSTWSLSDTSMITAIAVGAVTFLYTVFMLVFLLRKWYLLENGGWAKRRPTDFGLLDEARKETK